MTNSLLGWELSFEQIELHAANIAEMKGDLEAAIGHLHSCAAYMGISLPQPPLLIGGVIDNFKAMRKYFFKCKIMVGSKAQARAQHIRQSYSPITVRPKQKQPGASHDNGKQ